MNSIKNKLSLLGIILVIFLTPKMGISQEAQEAKQCHGQKEISGLTDDQKSKIDALKVGHQKQMMEYRAEKDKLEAELKLLEIADKADMNKINLKIDEITSVQGKIMKEFSKHRQDVRLILTPEQRVEFDNHKGHGCCKQGMMENGKEGGQHGQGCPNAKQ